MKHELITGTVGTALSAIGTLMQTNDVLETISLCITILGGIITFVIVPLYNWYKKSKSDGKITADEIKDGLDELADGLDKVKDDIDGKKGE